MSVAVPGAPFLRVRPAKSSDKPTKWGNPGLYFIALLGTNMHAPFVPESQS